jgi:hypothetical protein
VILLPAHVLSYRAQVSFFLTLLFLSKRWLYGNFLYKPRIMP